MQIIATEPAPVSPKKKTRLSYSVRHRLFRARMASASLVSSRAIAKTLRDSEEELGRIDALAGDGDHGMGITRGSAAAAEAAEKAVAEGAGAASVLAAAGNAWADRAGGTPALCGDWLCAPGVSR